MRCRLVVFAFGVRGLVFTFVEFPRAVDDVGVDGVGVLDSHFHVGESEFWGIGKAGHAFAPVRTAEDGRIPVLVRLRGHVTQIGNYAVFDPGAGAVESGRMAAIADERSIKDGAFFDHLRRTGLRRWHWNGWNHNFWSGKGSLAI